jgi:hypothetical protein
MCTSIIEIARAEGMAKRGDEWFPLSQAVVAYDHARHAPLGDVIPFPPPASVVLSIGDVLLYAGMAWFVFQVMRGRSRETPRPIAMWFLAYRGKHAPGHWRMAARYRAAAPVGAERSGTEP